MFFLVSAGTNTCRMPYSIRHEGGSNIAAIHGIALMGLGRMAARKARAVRTSAPTGFRDARRSEERMEFGLGSGRWGCG
jgi:hypothetical protein